MMLRRAQHRACAQHYQCTGSDLHSAKSLLDPVCRQPGSWTKSDLAFMGSLATLAVSVALSFLAIRQVS